MQKRFREFHPKPRWWRSIIRGAIKLALWLLTETTIVGWENIPRQGGFLVVANHFSFTDPVFMVALLPYQAEFMAGAAPIHAPAFAKWLPPLYGVIPLTRGGSSRDSLRIAEDILKEGGVVGIFPEAGSWAQVLRPARPGTSFLASRAAVPILPVGIDGSFDIFPALGRFQRAKVRIVIGQPFGPYAAEGRGRDRRTQLDQISHQIMQHIAALIPPERRGVYSEDLALREAAQHVAIYPWDDLVEGQVEAFVEKI
jgi:1-acyl-sn-glycerol-3-phosphate acyltransferase